MTYPYSGLDTFQAPVIYCLAAIVAASQCVQNGHWERAQGAASFVRTRKCLIFRVGRVEALMGKTNA